MFLRNLYNPAIGTFEACLNYVLRSDDTHAVYHRVIDFGGDDNLEVAASIVRGLAPLTCEFGALARPRTLPFRHTILSLAPKEDLSDTQMVDVSREAMFALLRQQSRDPRMPMVVAVHRDTSHLHTHIISVPLDLITLRRLSIPSTVSAYRRVLDPIEQRLGLSTVRNTGRWNDQRFYLPFSSWLAMDKYRLEKVRKALLNSPTWHRAIGDLAQFGIRFSPTSKNFSYSTKYFLRPFYAKPRARGASIQRDVFQGFTPAPTATDIVERWGDFPLSHQNHIEATVKPGEHYTLRPIGGERGELLFRKWQEYSRGKQSQHKQLVKLFDAAIKEANSKDVNDRTPADEDLLANPTLARRELLETAAAMKFSTWIEFQSDRGDLDAQWLMRIAANGTNQDPDACLKAETEGTFGAGEEAQKMRVLVRYREAERDRKRSTRRRLVDLKPRERSAHEPVSLTRPLAYSPARAVMRR